MASQNNDVKFEIKTENRNNSYLLWDGELKIKFQDGDEDVTLLVEIFHKDDSKGGEKLFDWTTTGAPVVSAKLYPMALLGGKSSNRLKNLKPFIKNSQLVAVKCKNLRQQELMVKELEQGDEEKNFFFADPGTCTPLVIVTVDKELYGSCVSLSSSKDILSSYEEFRSHFSSNIVQYNWSEGLDKETVSCQNKDLQSTEAITVQGSNRGGESTRQGMDIQPIRKPPLKCTLCDFTASSITALKRHIMRHTGDKPFTCTFCDYSCIQASDLRHHIKRKHTDQTLNSDQGIGIGSISNKLSDTVPSKITTSSGTTMPSDEHPFKCPHCCYSSSKSKNLKRHYKKHRGEKPFACKFCAFSCTQVSDLRIHNKRNHTSEKQFVCSECDYATTTSWRLKSHFRTHSGEKPYALHLLKCNECDFTASSRQSLKRHFMRHTGEKPFACTFCDYSCIQASDLRHHIRRKHSDQTSEYHKGIGEGSIFNQVSDIVPYEVKIDHSWNDATTTSS